VDPDKKNFGIGVHRTLCKSASSSVQNLSDPSPHSKTFKTECKKSEENVRQKENWQKTKRIWSFWSFVLFS
jgi:hypothetical protein